MTSTEPEQPEVRKAARESVTIRAQVRIGGVDKLTIDVTDLSRTGFQIETHHRLLLDARIWLQIPGLSGLEATVKWARRDNYGCAFVTPLHEAVFDNLVALAQKK